MKPHQLEGFNFLIKNLADENNPGGCILAHAPGSGKTFMLISFVQSFLSRYPEARPLIMLPKGILATWRTEFLLWKIEEIPLYDFYSFKAGNRSKQLKVLNMWEENRSILLLGYEQFAHIISAQTYDAETNLCKEKLLKVPSLVILDEGHTPRNEQTDLLTALETIQTPRKVVLSGTLFQNHVNEVFNILNLVWPKFLKMERSREIIKRILSKVDMLGKSARSMNSSDKYFCDVVEENLKRDGNDKVRVMIIQNLRELTGNVLHYYQGGLSEELPGLVDFTLFLNMSTEQEKIIKGLVGLKQFSRRSKCNAVSLHPCLKDVHNDNEKNGITAKKMGSIIRETNINIGAKAKFICELLSLSEAAGEKVLVFSQYVRSLLFLEMLIIRETGWKPGEHIFKINGKTTQHQRNEAVERFNHSPQAKILFGSIKACGEGISLVGASRVVILDVHENPSVMRQAIGRAFRPGQSKMVYCYRLVAADTPEEEDHKTAFLKERVSKMWFESNEFSCNDDFELSCVDVSESGDMFLESPALRQCIKYLYKRYAYLTGECKLSLCFSARNLNASINTSFCLQVNHQRRAPTSVEEPQK
jgi:DNA repair and recombination RAD54-like protein